MQASHGKRKTYFNDVTSAFAEVTAGLLMFFLCFFIPAKAGIA